MANGNAGFSIPGISQPNILERVGAILQGQQDPIHKAQALDIEQKMGMMKFQQGQEELGIKKEAAEQQKVKLFFELLKDIKDGEAKTKMVREFGPQIPAVKNYLGDAINKIEFTGAGDKFNHPVTVTRDPATGELTPKIINRVTGQPHPEGEYQVEGEFIGGKPRVDKVVSKKVEQATNREDRLAQELGFASFETAPVEAKTKINKQVLQEKVTVSAQQGAAGIVAAEESKEAIRRRQPLPQAIQVLTGTKTVMEAEQSGFGTIDPRSKEVKDLLEKRVNTRKVITGINSAQDKIEGNPAILGLPGEFSRIITSLSDQGKAFVDLLAPGTFDKFNSVEKHVNIFRATGIENPKLKSQLLGLAIAVTAAEGFGGREVTDRKIQINLQRLSGAVGGGSAEAAFKVLEQFKEEMAAGFDLAVEANLGAPPKQPFLRSEDKRTFRVNPSIPAGSEIKILQRRKAP